MCEIVVLGFWGNDEQKQIILELNLEVNFRS